MPASLAIERQQTETLREIIREVRGIQVSVEPELIADSSVLADSVNFGLVSAIPGSTRGGFLISRPGLRGALAAVQAGPVVACKRFVQPVAQTHCLLLAICNGPSSALCRVFLWTYGATTVTEVKDPSAAHVDFNAYPDGIDLGVPSIKFEQVGSYIFMIGAADTILRRMPLDSIHTPEIESGAGLLTPTTAPTVAITNYPLGTTPVGATDWAADAITGSLNDVLNGDFSGGSLTNWHKGGAMAVDTKQPYLSTWYVQLDDAPSFITSDRVLNNKIANTNDTTTPSGSAPRYATHFNVNFEYYTDSGGATDAVSVMVNLWDATSGGSIIATQAFIYAPGNTNTITQAHHVISFTGAVDPTAPLSYDVVLGNGGNARPGNNGPYMTNVSVTPFVDAATFAAAAGGGSGVDVMVNTYDLSRYTPTDQRTTLFLGDQRWDYVVNGGSVLDLSGVNTLDLPVALNATNLTGLSFRFGFKIGASITAARAATPIYSDPGQVLVTASGTTYLEADLTTLTAANRASLATTRIVEIYWQRDTPPYTAPFSAAPMTLQGFINAGDMSAGLPYFVVVQEEINGADITTATTLESGFSPISLEADTDHLNAALSIMPGALTNTGGAADSYKIGIGGGTDVTPSGQSLVFYQVYVVPISTGGGAWPGFSYSGGVYTSADGYATWNPTTRTLITDIPDSVRRQKAILTDHNQPPVNACAIAIFSNRVVLAAGNVIYISRLTSGVSQGVYYNDAPDPFAPDYSTAGNSDPVGVLEGVTIGGSIINLVPFGAELIVFFASYVYILSGTNNLNFNVRQYKRRYGIGLVARNAVALTESGVSLLALSGLYTYNGQDMSQDFAFEIAALLNPAAEYAGPALNVTSFSRSSIIMHDGRIYLSIPTASSGAVIAQTLVWDSRTKHWIGRWLLGAILCGETFTGSGETGALVLGDGNGMISTLGLNQYGDKALSGSTAAAVPVSFVGRRIVDPTNADNALSAVRYLCTVHCADTSYTWNFNIQGFGSGSSSWGSQAYTFAGAEGETAPSDPIPVKNATGPKLQQVGSASTVNALTVLRSGFEYIQTRPD